MSLQHGAKVCHGIDDRLETMKTNDQTTNDRRTVKPNKVNSKWQVSVSAMQSHRETSHADNNSRRNTAQEVLPECLAEVFSSKLWLLNRSTHERCFALLSRSCYAIRHNVYICVWYQLSVLRQDAFETRLVLLWRGLASHNLHLLQSNWVP